MATIHIGTLVQPFKLGNVEFIERCCVGVGKDGMVIFTQRNTVRACEALHASQPDVFGGEVINAFEAGKTLSELGKHVVDHGRCFISPGFVDTHNHGPQYAFAGTGADLPLLEWLEKYTFPTEAKFTDVGFARRQYARAVRTSLRCGTTTCCYFATIHEEATKVLVDVCYEYGQRAYVGKVCMDRNSPDYYCEKSAQESLDSTVRVVDYCQMRGKSANPSRHLWCDASEKKIPTDFLVQPIVTPRFAPSCSTALMGMLGDLAKERSLPVQTHISENTAEVAWMKELHPTANGYAHVYDEFRLLTAKTVLAHGVYLTDAELELLSERKSSVSHCANSNFNLRSGVCNVRRLLAANVNVCLGTDVAGGYSCSMFDAMRKAVIASTVCHFENRKQAPFSHLDAFYLATRAGHIALGRDGTCADGNVRGTLAPGDVFDALVLDAWVGNGGLVHVAEGETTEVRLLIYIDRYTEHLFMSFPHLGDISKAVRAGRRAQRTSRVCRRRVRQGTHINIISQLLPLLACGQLLLCHLFHSNMSLNLIDPAKNNG